jgi:hypothetical protein
MYDRWNKNGGGNGIRTEVKVAVECCGWQQKFVVAVMAVPCLYKQPKKKVATTCSIKFGPHMYRLSSSVRKVTEIRL